MQCPECNQLYKTEEWDKDQTCYSVKTDSQEAWQSLDTDSLIKERMVRQAGGLRPESCLRSDYDQQQVKGKANCFHNLYSTGIRA